jgi:3'-phosphoadenosine 5'-phosphosulfate sulfotransferase (PAPS reductase)/FAD synthetase
VRINLRQYDWIVVSTSGGKDSQTMLRQVVKLAEQQGVKDRVVAVHADMGRVEWPGVPELAREQAEHYGVRFELVRRPQGDLLEHVRDRAKKLRARAKDVPPVPSPTNRYCTSHHKADQVDKVLTALAAETRSSVPPVPSPTNRYCTSDHKRDQISKVMTPWRRRRGRLRARAVMPWMKPSQRYCTSDHKRDQQAKLLTRLARERKGRRPVRILQCMGMRAGESVTRSKLRPFYLDRRNSNTRKRVHIWLPIHDWTARGGLGRRQGQRRPIPPGLRPGDAAPVVLLLHLHAQAGPGAGREAHARPGPRVCRGRAEVGYSFRQELPMVEVIRLAESGEDCGPITTWEM